MTKRGNKNAKQAHQLIDRLAPRQVSAVVDLLEVMLDPVSRALAAAPLDDEPLSDSERAAVSESKAWFRKHKSNGIPQEELMAEFGAKPAGLRKSKKRA